MKQNTRLIVALDVTERKQALELANTLGDSVDVIKVGYPLVLGAGLDIVRDLSQYADVLCDFKVADIPNTNRLIVEQACERGAAGVIVHGFTGKDSVEACVAAAGDAAVFLVAEMSHPGALDFFQHNSEKLADMAVAAGCTGIVAPGTRPERIAALKTRIGDLTIISPGIGVQGGSARAALDAGADYIIVGRAIYEAENPKKAAEVIAAQLL